MGFFGGMQTKTRSRPPKPPVRLECEPLENRLMMAASLMNGVLNITGSNQNDQITIRQSGANVTVNITSGLTQGAWRFARAGIDSLAVSALGGNDTVSNYTDIRDNMYGNGGNDVLRGGSAISILYGNDGNDYLYGNNGHDVLIGGAGLDLLYGGNNNDSLFADDAAWVLVWVPVDLPAEVRGLFQWDGLDGGAGDDYLYGGASTDYLFGGTGRDVLYGRGGNDILDGGAGADTLNGGTGADIFRVSPDDDLWTVIGEWGTMDFNEAEGDQVIN